MDNKKMHASIYSLKAALYEGEVVSCTCETLNGQITILENHRPLITTLTSGVIKIIASDKKEHYINIKNGLAEISNNNIRIMVNN